MANSLDDLPVILKSIIQNEVKKEVKRQLQLISERNNISVPSLSRQISLPINNIKRNIKIETNHNITSSENKISLKTKTEIENLNLDDSKKEIDRVLIYLNSDSKKRNKICSNLSLLFERVSNLLSLPMYKTYIKSKSQGIDKSFENVTKNKKKKYYEKIFNTIGMRLIEHPICNDTSIKPKDHKTFQKILDRYIKNMFTDVKKYDKNYFKLILNISDVLSIFDLKFVFTKLFEHCNNIIYTNSTFYTLEDIKNNEFYWKQDHKLYDFSVFIYDNIRQHSISLFRYKYKNTFGDNIYRDNFFSVSKVMEYDCKKLLHNISILFNPNTFNHLLQTIIKKKCNIKPRQNDKFDMKCTVSTHKIDEDFESETYKKKIINELFDTISENQILDIFNILK